MSGTSVENAVGRLRFEHAEMAQQELADACSITRRSMIALKAGKFAPSLQPALCISHAFGVGVEDVFQGRH